MLDPMATTTRPTTEYDAVTTGCGLLDRSERGRLALSGADAKELLHGQVTNDVLVLAPGDGCYAAFLDHKGRMRGDLRILDAGEELLLDTERSTLQALFDMIRRYKLGAAVELHKRTLESGLLSLIGPRAGAIVGDEDLPQREHAHRAGELVGCPLRLIRTDVGVDVLGDAADTDRIAAELRARGAEPVSETTAECLRIERGRPRYGVDLDATTIPQEAGLNERAVSFTKGCYVGQETVARLHYRGRPNRHLRGLRLDAPTRHGATVTLGDRPIGAIGSTAISPRLGPIALALLRREAEPGMRVQVDGVDARVVALPF